MGVVTARSRSRSKVAKASRTGIRLGLGPVGLGTDATILVPDTGTKMVDFDSLVVGANTVYRQRGRIAGAGAAELADVKNAAPASNLYGIVVVGNDANLGATVTPKAASVWDVSDRAGRALGVVASITAAVDVSDRDARLLGRAKVLDSAGAVIDPALKGQLPAALTAAGNLKVSLSEDGGAVIGVDDNGGSLTIDSGQLPAALVGGRLDINIGASIALPVTDNGGSLTIDSGQMPATLGQKTMANSMAVVVSSDQSVIPVNDNAGSLTVDAPVGTPVFVRLSDGAAALVGQKAAASSIPVVLANDQSGATQATALFGQPRKLTTYRAVYRLAARPYALSNAFGAAGRKQFATIHHGATATKKVKIRHVWVALESDSAASLVVADLVRITAAPATGNPAITPGITDGSIASAEATCLALPTTAGTEGAVFSSTEWNLGITGAGTTVNPPPALQYVDLVGLAPGFDPDDEGTLPTIRAGVLEGWAVTIDDSAITTVKGFVIIEFTEE